MFMLNGECELLPSPLAALLFLLLPRVLLLLLLLVVLRGRAVAAGCGLRGQVCGCQAPRMCCSQ
jgi:hypothetical protein